MTPHPEKKNAFTFDNLTVSFRVVLPVMMAGYMVAYHNDVQWQKQNFNEIKEAQHEITKHLDSVKDRTDDRFAYVYQQCCQGAKTSPPSGRDGG